MSEGRSRHWAPAKSGRDREQYFARAEAGKIPPTRQPSPPHVGRTERLSRADPHGCRGPSSQWNERTTGTFWICPGSRERPGPTFEDARTLRLRVRQSYSGSQNINRVQPTRISDLQREGDGSAIDPAGGLRRCERRTGRTDDRSLGPRVLLLPTLSPGSTEGGRSPRREDPGRHPSRLRTRVPRTSTGKARGGDVQG